ncbi:ZinT family metal-binding protein [Paracoccus panacisoli]|uniref:ZinT family metal-binding protein n=1 Tax=Paracoccus panacisoli TaxID=1510163 RepID=A0ABV6T8Z8_9RHOB
MPHPSPRLHARLGALALVAALSGVALSPLAAVAESKPAHSHDHAHDHAKDPAAAKIYAGHFDDAQIKARTLADWAGEWQSVHPLLADGTLDPVMADKAAHGDKTAEGYRAYYDTGYKTDVDRLTIDGDRVTFHRKGGDVTGVYADDGHETLTYAKGNRGVRYSFRKTGGDAAAPGFIQFSDHRIAPEAADHFHLYWGDDRATVLAELTNWPTYYPAAMTPAEIVEAMLAH